MRQPAPVVLCLVLLAGCSTPGQTPATTDGTTTFEVVAGTTGGPQVDLTDTMHLLGAPHAAAALPSGREPIRTPVASTSVVSGRPPVTVGSSANVSYAQWDLPRPAGLDFLTGTALLYVEFQGTTANAAPTDPCYWRIALVAVRANAEQGVGVSTGDGEVCLPQPDALPNGALELHVVFPGQPVPEDAGDRLLLVLTSSATMTPGSAIHVLSGTPEHDSRITLNGLQVPLDVQTYL